MITIGDGLVQLHSKRTSMILSYAAGGLLQNLHYGRRIRVHDAAPLATKAAAGYGGDVLRGGKQPALSSLCLELSPHNRGDYRRQSLLIERPNGSATTDWSFVSARETGGRAPSGGMPQAHGAAEGVCVTFSEPSGLTCELYYTLFADADVITKKMRVINNAAQPVQLRRAMSHQLDLPFANCTLHTLTGAWVREFTPTKHTLGPGICAFGSTTGASSNRANPFFFLAREGAGEEAGEVYGFNLVYSGSHEAGCEVDTHGRLRVWQGVSSEGFCWPLAPGESFTTPEAVLTFSAEGARGMSANMHRFVQNHIVPARFRGKERPVLFNNWEGTYYNFNEARLLRMAKSAKRLGAELFVLDDGWFGRRNSDRAGLGDFDVNPAKLPGGLAGLGKKINAMGLDFGLWFEPECVNPDSALYEAHPDWAVATPGYAPATGRQQLVLDLCREEVRRYIVQSVNQVLDTAPIAYVKWDMNRHLSDNYSPALDAQGAFMHRYTLGLYRLFEGICETHPHVLFEGCSSGGNRFDLGVLCTMPQVWTSDDSDAHERQRIQTGASYGYPQSVMGCHVSAVPNHQTLRRTPLATRFYTAMFGLLGYELDPTALTRAERADVAAHIAFYKRHRQLLQYGAFYRLKTPAEAGDGCRWMAVSGDQSEAVVCDFFGLLSPNSAQGPMRLAGLDPDALYKIEVLPQSIPLETFGGLVNFISPVHLKPEGAVLRLAGELYRLPGEEECYTAYGDMLMGAGVHLSQVFAGAGYAKQMRFMADFASRCYLVRRIDAGAAPA